MINRRPSKAVSIITAIAFVMYCASCSKAPAQSETAASSETTSIVIETTTESTTEETTTEETSASVISLDDIGIKEEITNDSDSEHVIEADGESASYSNVKVTKTGDSDEGDKADFYGDNSAIFATDGATLTLTNIVVDTD